MHSAQIGISNRNNIPSDGKCLKNNPQVYITQEGIEENKNNPQVYTTQEGIEENKNNPQVSLPKRVCKKLKITLRYTLPKTVGLGLGLHVRVACKVIGNKCMKYHLWISSYATADLWGLRKG